MSKVMWLSAEATEPGVGVHVCHWGSWKDLVWLGLRWTVNPIQFNQPGKLRGDVGAYFYQLILVFSEIPRIGVSFSQKPVLTSYGLDYVSLPGSWASLRKNPATLLGVCAQDCILYLTVLSTISGQCSPQLLTQFLAFNRYCLMSIWCIIQDRKKFSSYIVNP